VFRLVIQVDLLVKQVSKYVLTSGYELKFI